MATRTGGVEGRPHLSGKILSSLTTSKAREAFMSTVCPRCGGTDVHPITPTFFECTSPVRSHVAPPEVTGGIPVEQFELCRHQFQVGAARADLATLCSCGRQSIGACHGCGRPLCGLHGTRQGAFLCAECLKARAAEHQRARQQAAADSESRAANQRAELKTDFRGVPRQRNSTSFSPPTKSLRAPKTSGLPGRRRSAGLRSQPATSSSR